MESPARPLIEAIAGLPIAEEWVPGDLDPLWQDAVRWTLEGWARELDRDLRRVGTKLDVAAGGRGGEPTEGQVAALEEVFWRLQAATEKVDAVVSLLFAEPLIIPRSRPKTLRIRPRYGQNTAHLRALGTEAALTVVRLRGQLEGERAGLRRNQLAHSLVPIVKAHDLACYVLVHHRDGRIMVGGYEWGRLTAERGLEGIKQLTAEALFEQRLVEAGRAHEATLGVVQAVARLTVESGTVRLPQVFYREEDTGVLTIERPESTGPPPHYEIDFYFGDSTEARRISSSSPLRPGQQLVIDGETWRVTRVEGGKADSTHRVYCLKVEAS